MNKRKVWLYVKSIKNLIGTKKVGGQTVEAQIMGGAGTYVHLPPRTFQVYKVRSVEKYEYILPDHQKEAVDIVEEVAPKLGFEAEIIDVSKVGVLDRTFKKEIRKLKTFPTLVTDSGKLKTKFTKSDLEAFLSKETAKSQKA